MAMRQFVVFNVNDEEFGIDIEHVNIIERTLEIFKIPNTPEYIEGLINLRGKVHTVINLRKRFNMPAKAFDDSTKIIMVSTSSAIVGLIVDEVREIVKIDDKDIENTPNVNADLHQRYIDGAAKMGERIILLLNLDTVLVVDEKEKAAAR